MTRRLHKTAADYIAIAACPVLIMLLVDSLAFFILEVSSPARWDGRLRWILFWYVFAIVLVARISIQSGRAAAAAYAAALGVATSLVMFKFATAPIVALILLGVIWWCADKLTWDCTLIDDEEDSSGEGLLGRVGLDETTDPATDDVDKKVEPADELPLEPVSWQQRLVEKKKRPHAPGVWIVYFSLATLPLFGIGQALLPAGNQAARTWGFRLLWIYVASALGLLLLTSFLGMRRYLRQRRIQMPAAIAGTWVGMGAGLALAVLVFCLILPRPDAAYSMTALIDQVGEKAQEASDHAFLDGDSGKGDGKRIGEEHDPDDKQPDETQEEDEQPDDGGDAKKKRDGKGGTKKKAKEQKPGEDGKSKQSKRSKSNDSDSKESKGADAKDAKSKSDDSSRKGDDDSKNSGDKSKHKDDSRKNKSDNNQSKSEQGKRKKDENAPRNDDQRGKQDEPADDEKQEQEDDRQNDDAQQQDSTPDAETEMPSLPQLSESVGTLVKLLIYAILIAIVIYVCIKHRVAIARGLQAFLEHWRNFWANLFGGRKDEADSEDRPEGLDAPVRRPYADFPNPYGNGQVNRMSPEGLIRYTFEALQAWGREHSHTRHPDQTPLEYARVLDLNLPVTIPEIRQLAQFYAAVAYGRRTPSPKSLEALERLWSKMDRMQAGIGTMA